MASVRSTIASTPKLRARSRPRRPNSNPRLRSRRKTGSLPRAPRDPKGDQEAVLSLADHLPDAGDVGGHDRHAAGHRLLQDGGRAFAGEGGKGEKVQGREDRADVVPEPRQPEPLLQPGGGDPAAQLRLLLPLSRQEEPKGPDSPEPGARPSPPAPRAPCGPPGGRWSPPRTRYQGSPGPAGTPSGPGGGRSGPGPRRCGSPPPARGGFRRRRGPPGSRRRRR